MSFLDSETRKSYQAKAKSVILAASTLESARLMLLSKSTLYPNGIGNSSGHVGHNFCEHMMGPSISGFQKELIGKPKLTTMAVPAHSICRAFATSMDQSQSSCVVMVSKVEVAPV